MPNGIANKAQVSFEFLLTFLAILVLISFFVFASLKLFDLSLFLVDVKNSNSFFESLEKITEKMQGFSDDSRLLLSLSLLTNVSLVCNSGQCSLTVSYKNMSKTFEKELSLNGSLTMGKGKNTIKIEKRNNQIFLELIQS